MADRPPDETAPEAVRELNLPSIVRKAGWSALVGLALLGGAMAGASRLQTGISWRELASRAEPGPIVIASVLMSGAFFFMGNRWRALMPAGNRAHPGGLTAMLCTGLLLNYAFPGPVGEVGAAWFAHRRYRLSLADSLASGVAARVVGLTSAAMLSGLLWLLHPLPVPEVYRPLVGGSALLLGAGGVVLAYMAARPRIWQRIASHLLGLVQRPPALARLATRVNQGVIVLTDSLAEVATRGWWAYTRAVLWALGGHAAVMAGIWLAATSFGAQPEPVGIVFTYAMTTAGAALLFAFPGSQLGWDAMFVSLLVASSGLGLQDALAVAAVVRLQQVGMLGVGALALAWLTATGRETGGDLQTGQAGRN